MMTINEKDEAIAGVIETLFREIDQCLELSWRKEALGIYLGIVRIALVHGTASASRRRIFALLERLPEGHIIAFLLRYDATPEESALIDAAAVSSEEIKRIREGSRRPDPPPSLFG